MIYIDLIDNKPAIDWQRFDRDRALDPYMCFTDFAFTTEAIAALQGSPKQKIKTLEKLLDKYSIESFVQKDGKYCCRLEWLARTGYGTGNTKSRSFALAQLDLINILCDHPVDAYRHNDTWDEYSSLDYY